MSIFTERDTEHFYDTEDSFYRQFWDEGGELHWGFFDDSNNGDFVQACQRWNKYMLEKAQINSESVVLDLGCGNGVTSIWLAQQTGCKVTGIDISQVRIDNAKEQANKYPQLQLSFHKSSATSLPFEDNIFTHVWSQAVLYHVHDRRTALQEVFRVLIDGGTFVFDDLVQPKPDISAESQKHVYNRLLFQGTYSQESYKKELIDIGFMVFEVNNISYHLKRSYQLLSQKVRLINESTCESYQKMCDAVDKCELGWSFFLCEKVKDRLSWIYGSENKQTLEKKYDAWASCYDSDLDEPYRCSPDNSACMLAEILQNNEASVLDVGCGSGMVGETLAELGYTNITGIDLSEGMLKSAKQKNVYKQLTQGDIECPEIYKEEMFDALIAVGVFTYNHAGPSALEYLLPYLKKGGIFVITVRSDYYNTNSLFRDVVQKLPWELINRNGFEIFNNESMYALAFRKTV